MVNYENGKIYQVTNTVNATRYIGSTTSKYLSNRMAEHRQDSANATEARQESIKLNREANKLKLRCEDCDLGFGAPTHLARHLKSHVHEFIADNIAGSRKKFGCITCNWSGASSKDLGSHLKTSLHNC